MPDSISRALKAAMSDGPISFADFMRIALYHPEEGYYRRNRERVGFGETTDFFTASSMGPVFAELVVEAACRLVEPEKPSTFSFVEIGAEPARKILQQDHPFAAGVTLRHGDSLEIPNPSVVFSNELFDAQPFHRLVFTAGSWREIGVAWQDGPVEILLPEFSPAVAEAVGRLPKTTCEGYRLDLPLEAANLVEKIASASDWRGVFLMFDYGKTWRELTEATPQGTARAYRRHRQATELLAAPGEQDLTCHICWDWMEEALNRQNFTEIRLQSQESFFVRHAARAIEKIITTRPGELDPRRQTLQQLLHPGNMGQKFQVLTGRR